MQSKRRLKFETHAFGWKISGRSQDDRDVLFQQISVLLHRFNSTLNNSFVAKQNLSSLNAR